jgi:hypothetical protein
MREGGAQELVTVTSLARGVGNHRGPTILSGAAGVLDGGFKN